MKISPSVVAILLVMATSLRAEAPRVVTDIAPVHALVAQVMQQVGTPDLLMSPGVSPHTYAMRPSQARMLQNANLVVWMGPELTPSMGESIRALNKDAVLLQLLQFEDTEVRQFRSHDDFGGHGQETDHADEHEHDHGHEDEHGSHKTDHGHAHEGADPHAWLDPRNAQVWLVEIARVLSEMDPANASAYAQNASQAASELDLLQQDIQLQLGPLKDQPFVVFHDAYQYFEARFGLTASGALLDVDGAAPSAARLRAIRDTLVAEDVTCLFTEPQFDAGLATSVSQGIDLQVIEVDPMGVRQAPGAGLYVRLLTSLGEDFVTCLSAGDN